MGGEQKSRVVQEVTYTYTMASLTDRHGYKKGLIHLTCQLMNSVGHRDLKSLLLAFWHVDTSTSTFATWDI
jgi:hypothetical protein